MPSNASEEELANETKLARITMANQKCAPHSADADADAEVAGLPPGMIDAHAERRLLRKIDFHVWPILFVIYMMSFLDRINISNARIQGMTEELDLYGNKFNIALFVSHTF